jgi:hypothetical protein
MRRRTGWLTTCSASLVVKPTPVSAERAWNLADSRDKPVRVKATVAMRLISSDKVRTIKTEASAVKFCLLQITNQQRRRNSLGNSMEFPGMVLLLILLYINF